VDEEQIFRQLVDGKVDFVLVGGLAAVAQGVVHLTNDVDICYAPDPANLTRLTQALAPLHPRLRVESLTDEQARTLPFQWDARTILATELLTLKTDAGSLDLIRVIPGVGSYADVRAASVPVDFFDMRVITLDLPALIESKRAVRRPKDLAALPHIEAVLRTREAAESTED